VGRKDRTSINIKKTGNKTKTLGRRGLHLKVGRKVLNPSGFKGILVWRLTLKSQTKQDRSKGTATKEVKKKTIYIQGKRKEKKPVTYNGYP